MLREHRKARRAAKEKLTKKENGSLSVKVVGACEKRILRAFAANTMDPNNARVAELLSYLESIGAATDAKCNGALSFIDSMEPQSQMKALARMHRCGGQPMRDVHIDNRGGQAVIADTIQTGGKWKILRTMPCNRPRWPQRRDAWRGAVRGRRGNRQR